MIRKSIIMLMLIILPFSSLYAQEETAATVSDEDVSISEEGNVSLDFRDADIQNVLRILSYKSGVNIVVGPEVTGLVTIKLQDVPWEQALNVILQTYGYAYEQSGNIITVSTVEKIKQRREDALALAEQEPLVTKTFVLNYAKAGTAIVSVDKMRTERGSVNFDDRTNSLIVRDTAENVETIGEVIKGLDQPTPQVLIEAKIVETTLDDDENLGVNWVVQAGMSGSTRPHVWPFTTASENKYLDTAIPSPTTGFSYGTLDFNQFSSVLELLSTRTDTNILSNPRIVTLDNQKAVIDVGIKYPFANKFYNSESGTWEFQDWRYEKIGIVLDVTPHINQAGLITLDIHPQVTEILELVTDAASGSVAPKLSNEEAETQVMIKDGETLVIAGLIKDKETESVRKVPLLGDIPFLGKIFRKTVKQADKTDLLIFITPHIVTPEIDE